MTQLLQPNEPLWLPLGSVRAIIAIAIVGAYIAGLVTQEIALVVLAFYFASRSVTTE